MTFLIYLNAYMLDAWSLNTLCASAPLWPTSVPFCSPKNMQNEKTNPIAIGLVLWCLEVGRLELSALRHFATSRDPFPLKKHFLKKRSQAKPVFIEFLKKRTQT